MSLLRDMSVQYVGGIMNIILINIVTVVNETVARITLVHEFWVNRD